MITVTIPVYWGDTNIQEDVNIKSIIDLRKPEKEILEEIKEIVGNRKFYLDKLSEKWFVIDHAKRYKEHSLQFIESHMLEKNLIMKDN